VNRNPFSFFLFFGGAARLPLIFTILLKCRAAEKQKE